MSLSQTALLFAALFVLALLPAPSVFAVAARAMSSGFRHGLMTTIGVVSGDLVFILFAFLGLWSLTESLGELFVVIKYLGAAYLIGLGVRTLRTPTGAQRVEGVRETSWWSNYLCGLLLTLSDPRAVLFYLSFLPAYLNLQQASPLDIALVMITATLSVGAAKLVYAFLGDRAATLSQGGPVARAVNWCAALVMIGTAIFLVLKS